MIFSSHTSVVFVGRESVARADLSGGVVRNFGYRARPATVDVLEAVDLALRAAPGRPGQTYVLLEDASVQRVRMAPGATSGLEHTEVARLLAFEAESLSGNSALDSETGYVALGNDEFWTAQISRRQRDQIDERVNDVRGRLKAILHPGGGPFPLEAGQGPWRRIETWSGATIATGGQGFQNVSRMVLTGDARTTASTRVLTEWASRFPPETINEELSSSARRTSERPTLSLTDEATVRRFLTGWGMILSAGTAGVPTIAPPPRTMSVGQQVAIAAGLFLFASSFMSADAFFVYMGLANADQTVKQASQAAQAHKGYVDDAKKSEEKIAKLKNGLAQLQHSVAQVDATFHACRNRVSLLVDCLAERCPENVVIESIATNNGVVTVKGKSLGDEPLHRFVSALDSELRPHGWTVEHGLKSLGPVRGKQLDDFTIVFEDCAILPSNGATPPVVESFASEVPSA